MRSEIVNNHWILWAEDEEGIELALLADTGMPVTTMKNPLGGKIWFGELAFDPGQNLVGQMLLQFFSGDMVEDIGFLIGMPIDGVLGADFFQSCDVEVDFSQGSFSLSDGLLPLPEESVEVDLFELPTPSETVRSSHAPVVPMRLGNQELRAFVDTGSMYTMVHTSLVADDFQFVRTIREFHPVIGWFEARLYDAPELVLGGGNLGVQRVAASKAFDNALRFESLGTNAILGLQTCLNGRLFLSYRQKRMALR